jgi:hypothetical protein
MRFGGIVRLTALSALLFAPGVYGQKRGPEIFGTDAGQTPVLELGAGYTYLHANAPPAQCGCFSANGGYGSAVFSLPRGFGLVADLAAAHAGNVGGTTQSITVFNYLFGPRYSLRGASKHFVPYAQALGGGQEEISSYAAVGTRMGAAFSLGGGVSTTLWPHFGWTIVEADWVQSRLPNAKNNLQNDVRVSSGFTFRLGPR